MKKLSDRFGKNGFTLVELTVVLVILGILAAIGIPTAAHFIRQAEYRRNEENAKTAYLAAESTLTWYRTSGEWERFREQMTAKDVGALNETFAPGDRREGRIYAVAVNHWNGGASKSGELARELLDGGVYSGDFYDAEIVLEVDAESGQVYSAFYGTRCSSLTYEEDAQEKGQCISAAGNWREIEVRREAALGYYSVEDAVHVAELKKVRLKVTTINLINSETLSLNWTSNSRNNNLDVKYLLTFYREDPAEDQELFTTEVELGSLRGELKTGNGSSKTGMVHLELKDREGEDAGRWAFPLTYQQTDSSGGRFSLVLDGMMTAELAEVVKADPAAARELGTGITRLETEIPEFGSAQNIYVEILAQQACREITGEDGETVLMEVTEYKPGRAVRSNTENTLFARGNQKDAGLEAEITRFRHLSNIRYQERTQPAVFTVTGRNLDWTLAGVGMYGVVRNETGENGVSAGLGTVEWQSTAGKGQEQILDFPSIPLLGAAHRLEGKSGIKPRLTNLHLGAGSMPSDEQIGSLYGAGSADRITHYLGLFCESEGQISNLALTDPVLCLTGEEDGAAVSPSATEDFGALYGTGILCGRNQGSLSHIAVRTTDRTKPTVQVCLKDQEAKTQRTPAGIGGLVGILAGKNPDDTLCKLTDSAVTLSELTMEGTVTGYLPNPDAGTDTGSAGAVSAEERAADYPCGVGGLFGYAWIGKKDGAEGVQLTACVNHADVSGNLCTGGIAGALKGDFVTGAKEVVSIRDSKNDGLVRCLPDRTHPEEENRLEGRCFGGILGYGDGAQLSGCVNASEYREVFDKDKKEELLHGHYAGGILGYGNNSQLVGCSTQKGSYVFGSHYVGGIAGGLSNNLEEAITGADQGEDLGIQVTTNAGYVIGYRYVGGIVGRNDGSETTTISNCVNNGVAAGYDRYIGGIVGYNGTKGVVSDCASYFSDYGGSVYEMIVGKWQAAGNCTGGLAGYNNGKIRFSAANKSIQVKSVSSIVVGRNYVGGTIGFNDINGTLDVEAYELIGGRIHGTGSGVGGCIGLNASASVLEERFAVCPSSVEGNYHVGGCIGANVVDLKKPETPMKDICTDSHLGSVAGNAFTGGVIGYQRTYTDVQVQEKLHKDNTGWFQPDGGAVFDEENHLLLLSYIEGMEAAAGTKEKKEAVLGTAGGLLPLLEQGTRVPTPVLESQNENLLTIGERAGDGKQTEYNNMSVSSNLYTGGIVGYCERYSRLHIINSRNSGSLYGGSGASGGVSLKAYLTSREVGAKSAELDGEGKDPEISVGGGIIGANLEHQIIDHCVNEGIMSDFVGLGGIVGFNAGGVFNCSLTVDFGSTDAEFNYIGGVVGLNVHAEESWKTDYKDVKGVTWKDVVSGTVAGCATAERTTVFGHSYVGGIAGYNLSGAELRSNRNRSGVTGSGDYVGGIAGVNSGRITMQEEKDRPADYTIAGSSGEGIGGIAGWNRAGGIIEVAGTTATRSEVVAVDGNVSVTGKIKVGGVIGANEGSLAAAGGKALVCQANRVHALEGYAGGIIGEAGKGTSSGADEARITGAINRSGIVTADRGPAGGVTAVNRQDFYLVDCTSLGNVSSDNGYAGGIAAENYGWIEGCRVSGGTGKYPELTVKSEGADAIGAVCAVNYGTLWNSAPAGNVILSGSAGIVGGIAGRNAAGGQIGITGQEYSVEYMPSIAIDTAALIVGGVAGQNQSALPAESKPAAEIRNMTVKGLAFEEFRNYRYVGGVTGENLGGALVENCLFQDGKITQGAGTAAGNCYGGIAGSNDGELRSCRIEGIQIKVEGIYTATATSTAAEKETLSSHVGGVAGRNGADGVIAGCRLNDAGSSRIEAEYGMAGGVAGYNRNEILLSGDAATDTLMGKQTGSDGSVYPAVEDVKALITKAGTAPVSASADAKYVNWTAKSATGTGSADIRTADVGRHYYNGSTRTVDEDRSLTLLMTGNGNLGGITAYNAPSGKVSYCATGNWYLNNRSEAIGVGTGGIIGMNESEKDQTFLLNQAFVGRQVAPDQKGNGKTDRFAGGIIGNQNNTTGSGWTIRNCVNYGTVYCKYTHYSGGIVGQWTGTGGNIEKCYNFGNLQTTCTVDWLGASAGIVAQLYHAYENNEYRIAGCANYGNLFARTGRSIVNCANDSAGILGNVTVYTVDRAENSQKFSISVTDCVNGPGVEIYSKSMASGIVGFLSMDSPGTDTVNKILRSTSNIRLDIERCRNYASVLKGQNFVAGIFGDRYGETGAAKTTVKYCFSADYSEYVINGTGSQPYPIVSCRNGESKPGSMNQKDTSVSNFFLSNRTSITGFSSDALKSTLGNNNSTRQTLQRVNANWIHSFKKGGTRYFVYITGKGNPPTAAYTYETNDTSNYLSINDKDEVIYHQYANRKWTETTVGEVLFTITGNDADKYAGMDKVVIRDADFDYFQNFDTYVREFCFTRASLLTAPEKVVLSGTGDGGFLVKVDAPAYAGSEEIEYVMELYRRKDANDSEGTLIEAGAVTQISAENITDTDTFRFTGETCTFTLTADEMKKGGELFVKVRARKRNETSVASSWTVSNAVPTGTVLPDPKLRIELRELVRSDGKITGSVYRFRLTNPEAYKADPYKALNIQIHIRLMDGTELKFDPDGTADYTATADSLQQLVVWAAVEGASPGFGITSSEMSVPVYLPAYKPMIAVGGTVGTSAVKQPFCTVSGSSRKDLTVTVTLTGPGGSITTPPVYRAELLGDWKEEDRTERKDYVFRTADVLTVADGQVSAVFGGFSGESAMESVFAGAENIRVRVWYVQSGLGPVYTYYPVDPDQANTRTGETPAGAGEALPQMDAYTPVLDDGAFEDYRWTSGELFQWLPAPELMTVSGGESLRPEIDSADGSLKYTFRWDEDISPNTNTYLVTLTGVTGDEAGNPVSIVTDREVTGESFELETEDWPYDQVILSVTRKGYTASDGVIYIGKTSSGTYGVKKRLPRPEQPRAVNPDVNELQYEIQWSPVSPEVGGDTVSGCSGYELYIRSADADPDSDPYRELRVEVRKGDGTLQLTDRGFCRRMVDLEDFAGQRVRISVRALADDGDAVYVQSVDGAACELVIPERIPDPEIAGWEKSWAYARPDPSDPDHPDGAKSVEEFEGGGPDGLKVALTTDPAHPESIPPGGSSYLTKAYVFENEADARAVQTALLGGTEADLHKVLAYYPAMNVENQWIPAGMEPERAGGNRFSHTLTGLSAEYAGKYILFTARISSGGGKASSRWVIQQNGDTSIWRLPCVKLPTPDVSAETGESQVRVRFIYNPDLGGGDSISADDPDTGEANAEAQIGADGAAEQAGNGIAEVQPEAGAGDGQTGDGSAEAQADEDAPDPQADAGQEEQIWTAESTIFTWSSVKYADVYDINLSDHGESDGSGAVTAEFKVVEFINESDPSASTAAVYGRASDGSGGWEEIGTTDPAAGAVSVFDLSQTDASFLPYGRTVRGSYALDTSTSIVYEAELKTRLEITMADGVFTCRLILPDSNRLNPPADSGYENGIVDSDSDRLRFTDEVRIWSDRTENGDPDPGNWSSSYVKSDDHVTEFDN